MFGLSRKQNWSARSPDSFGFFCVRNLTARGPIDAPDDARPPPTMAKCRSPARRPDYEKSGLRAVQI